MNISFFRQKLSGSFKNNNGSNAAAEDGGVSRVFDPADLEMLKNSASRRRDPTSKSELVTLFRSRLNVVHTND